LQVLTLIAWKVLEGFAKVKDWSVGLKTKTDTRHSPHSRHGFLLPKQLPKIVLPNRTIHLIIFTTLGPLGILVSQLTS
jgi:hypothetical protein